MSYYSRVILTLILVFMGLEAAAHIRLNEPVPRSNSDGLKTAPCGGIARTALPTKLTVGQVLPVRWTETINHPGYYTFEFSPANDTDFVELLRVEDNQNTGGMHSFTGSLTIPNVPCTNCTIRLLQYMTENPASPRLYYSCADVTIEAALPPPPPPDDDDDGTLDTGSHSPGGHKGGGKMSGGCGLVTAVGGSQNGRGGGMPPPTTMGFILLPLMAWAALRRSRQLAVVSNKK